MVKITYVCVSEVPQDHPDSMFCEEDSQYQHMVVYTADKGLSPGETRHKLPRVLSQWSRTGCTKFPQSWVPTAHVTCCQPGNLIRDLAPKVSTGGWSRRQPLPGKYPTSRLPEGKQEFRIYHSAHTNSPGTVII